MQSVKRTFPSIPLNHHDLPAVQRAPQPILAEVVDRELHELGDVVDSDDFACRAGWTGHEVV